MRRVRLGLTCALLTFAVAAPASAATLAVTTNQDVLGDDGQCSLREAILVVDGETHPDCTPSGAGALAISLAAQTYALHLPSAPAGVPNSAEHGDLDVTGAVTITGAGASTVIDASGIDRVFRVQPGASLTLRSLTVTGGHPQDGSPGVAPAGGDPGLHGDQGGRGGGIYSGGTLTLDHVVVRGNQSGTGGPGVAGTTGNAAAAYYDRTGGSGGDGGGIYSFGTLRVSDSTISDNRTGNGGAGSSGAGAVTRGGDAGSGGFGGGIDVAGGSATIDRSTISGNRTGDGGHGADGVGVGPNGPDGAGGHGGSGGVGGGLAFTQDTSTSTITNSTIAGNRAGDGGAGGAGGVSNAPGNGSQGGYGGYGGDGGAMYVAHLSPSDTTLHLVSDTIADNAPGDAGGGGPSTPGTSADTGGFGVPGLGGGIYNEANSTVKGTIIASNLRGNCLSNVPADLGANLETGGGTCGLRNADLKLGPLTDNGGPTQTMALGAGSAAIDGGGTACPTVDQRGVARPYGSACDVGALEFDPTAFPAPPAGSAGGSASTTPGGSPGIGNSNTTAVPTIGPLKLAAARFSTTVRRNGKTKKVTKAGTTLTFTLSEPATVTFTVARATVGLRSGSTCGKLPKKPKKGAKHCVLFVAVGSFALAGKAGTNTYAFTGKLKRKALAKAKYLLTAVAKDATGHVSAPVAVPFAIR
jgi:hypothetical protein